jgi:hypothetical protein
MNMGEVEVNIARYLLVIECRDGSRYIDFLRLERCGAGLAVRWIWRGLWDAGAGLGVMSFPASMM